jgi:hypothetical protein
VVAAVVNHGNSALARPALEALVEWVANDGHPPASGL